MRSSSARSSCSGTCGPPTRITNRASRRRGRRAALPRPPAHALRSARRPGAVAARGDAMGWGGWGRWPRALGLCSSAASGCSAAPRRRAAAPRRRPPAAPSAPGASAPAARLSRPPPRAPAVPPSTRRPSADFYRGKTIPIITGSAPVGTYDTYLGMLAPLICRATCPEPDDRRRGPTRRRSMPGGEHRVQRRAGRGGRDGRRHLQRGCASAAGAGRRACSTMRAGSSPGSAAR